MPLGQVKIAELGAWFGRRNKSPQAMMSGISRAWWRWQHKYVQPKRAGIAPMFQLIGASMLFFYTINYGKTSKCGRLDGSGHPEYVANRSIFSNSPFAEHHRNYKYH